VKKQVKITIGIVMSFFILSCISLGVVISATRPNAIVSMYPSTMDSYPGNTAWIVAEVESVRSVEFDVKLSHEIPFDYKIWSTGSFNHVVEIFLQPTEDNVDEEIKVNLLAGTGKLKYKIGSTIVYVINWSSQILSEDILNMREQFVNYIEANTTFSKINSSTDWNFFGTVPILIVEHYLFKSEFWEMELSRHVMIPPYDWVQIYIRPRNASVPLWSAKIDSWSLDNTSIYEIQPPDEIYR
jgi:hypothetical protein